MTYEEAQNYIQKKNELGSVLGLKNIKELLRRLGNPQNKCKVIHIAGTNGKGSILACLDAMLRNAGYQVGRYISPTIFCYLERFQINGKYMGEAAFAAYLSRLAPVVEEMIQDGDFSVTAFEIETALAFLYFFEENVDVVLLETGMGGRLDATNVVEKPVCTILSSIRLDHMKILGDTIEAIAYEKCGILRDDVPCVVYPENEAAMPVIREQCKLHKLEPVIPDLTQLVIQKEDLWHEKFAYKNVNYALPLLGEHQIYNAITAIEAYNVFEDLCGKEAAESEPEVKQKTAGPYNSREGKYGLKKVNAQKGLQNVRWQGRFEIMSRRPYVIRDGAHNVDAAMQLKKQLIKHFTNQRIIYIIGMLGDKEHHKMLSILGPLAQKAYVITVPDNVRALPAELLAEEVREYIEDVVVAESPEDALTAAKQDASENDVIVAFGSLYYIGKLGEKQEAEHGTNRQNLES